MGYVRLRMMKIQTLETGGCRTSEEQGESEVGKTKIGKSKGKQGRHTVGYRGTAGSEMSGKGK